MTRLPIEPQGTQRTQGKGEGGRVITSGVSLFTFLVSPIFCVLCVLCGSRIMISCCQLRGIPGERNE